MDLLEKFDTVKICAGNRITEADRQFCQKQQARYQDAVEGFYQIAGVWMDMCANQKSALPDQEDYTDAWRKDYLTSRWWPDITVKKIVKHIFHMHSSFISKIVSYLNSTYYLSLDAGSISDELLPEEPAFSESEDTIDWSEFPPLVLRYEDIVDLILSWFNGRTFEEQAPYELLENCHRTAWDLEKHTANFEQKKMTVKFFNNACSYGFYNRCQQWHISDSMKHILKGLARFETGSFDRYPDGLDDLIADKAYLWYDQWDFDDCKKLERIRMYKNGRLDIRFTNEGYARQFIAEYLGTVA